MSTDKQLFHTNFPAVVDEKETGTMLVRLELLFNPTYMTAKPISGPDDGRHAYRIAVSRTQGLDHPISNRCNSPIPFSARETHRDKTVARNLVCLALLTGRQGEMKGRTRATPHKRVNTVVVRRVSHGLLTTHQSDPWRKPGKSGKKGWIVGCSEACEGRCTWCSTRSDCRYID
jgi:hypothetical protein